MITGLGRKFTKRGDQMAVFVLEDLEATIEVTVFPRMLQEQGHKLEDDIIVAVKGRLDKRDESRFGLIALDIQVLAGLAENAAASLRLALPSHALDELRIQRLKRILRDHPGDSVVLIELGRGKVLRLSDEFRVDIDRAVGELRMAFGHEAVLLCPDPVICLGCRAPHCETGRFRWQNGCAKPVVEKRGHGGLSSHE